MSPRSKVAQLVTETQQHHVGSAEGTGCHPLPSCRRRQLTGHREEARGPHRLADYHSPGQPVWGKLWEWLPPRTSPLSRAQSCALSRGGGLGPQKSTAWRHSCTECPTHSPAPRLDAPNSLRGEEGLLQLHGGRDLAWLRPFLWGGPRGCGASSRERLMGAQPVQAGGLQTPGTAHGARHMAGRKVGAVQRFCSLLQSQRLF